MLTAAVVVDGTSDWVPVLRAARVWLPRRPLYAYGHLGETAGVGTSPLAAEVVPLLPGPFVDGTLWDMWDATWVGPEALSQPLGRRHGVEKTSGLDSFVAPS